MFTEATSCGLPFMTVPELHYGILRDNPGAERAGDFEAQAPAVPRILRVYSGGSGVL